mgnify:CR=1 FL=1|jgi:hypothetical protein
MAKSLNIKLPKDILAAPENVRRAVLETLRTAMKLPKEVPLVRGDGPVEHKLWERNSDELMADTEDAFYEWLIQPATERMADLFIALGLSLDGVKVEKAFSKEFDVYADQLVKARGGRKPNAKKALEELIKIGREKREAFLKYINDAKPLSKKDLRALDKLLRSKLAEYAQKTIEAFQVRAGMLAKIRNQADKEFFTTVGAYVDRYPETVKAAEREHTVLTIPEKRKADAEGRKVIIKPLTRQEAQAVEHAVQSAAEKISEVNERHINGIRQLVVRAKRERWSAERLAQELYDMYGEQNRDWRRVAITELAMADNDAYLSGVEEGETVVGMSSAGMCKQCEKLITSKTYIVTHDPEKMNEQYGHTHVWPGKTNFGRRVSEYWPCIPLHPNCRCRWHRISRFYKMVDGKLVMKTTAELIQEERARRGLPPDPNLKEE